jgi:hypothetical protein
MPKMKEKKLLEIQPLPKCLRVQCTEPRLTYTSYKIKAYYDITAKKNMWPKRAEEMKIAAEIAAKLRLTKKVCATAQ